MLIGISILTMYMMVEAIPKIRNIIIKVILEMICLGIEIILFPFILWMLPIEMYGLIIIGIVGIIYSITKEE